MMERIAVLFIALDLRWCSLWRAQGPYELRFEECGAGTDFSVIER
jgi:hypothetical protein